MDTSISAGWSQGQRDALIKLRNLAELFFFREWPSYRIKLRLNPLLAGPSGVGKSHLVRALAGPEEFDLPVLRITPSSWIPSGVRDSLPTLARVHDFVTTHDLGILNLDESDKFYQSSSGDFSRYVRGEAFDLLDGTISQTSKDFPWNSKTLAKLRSSFLIIGSGTWQSIWSQPDRKSLGFGAQAPAADKADQIRRSDAIPEKLLRRFHSELILIPPATEKNFCAAAEHMGLTALAAKIGYKLDFAEGVASGYGARWLEGQFTKLLLLAQEQGGHDVLRLRNPYPIEDFPPDEEDPDDRVLG